MPRITVEVPAAELEPQDVRPAIVVLCDCGRELSVRVPGSATCEQCGRYWRVATVALDAERRDR